MVVKPPFGQIGVAEPSFQSSHREWSSHSLGPVSEPTLSLIVLFYFFGLLSFFFFNFVFKLLFKNKKLHLFPLVEKIEG